MRRRKKRGDDDDDVLVPAAVISLAAPAPQLPEDPVGPEPGYSSGMLQQYLSIEWNSTRLGGPSHGI